MCGHIEFVFTAQNELAINALGAVDIAVSDVLFQGIAPSGAGKPADPLAISKDGFATQKRDFRVANCESGKLIYQWFTLFFD